MKRFSGIVTNVLLLLVVYYCFTRPPATDVPFRMRQTLGGYVIFDDYVTMQTQCIVPAWEGNYFNRSQHVAWIQFKDLWKYEQKPMDSLGWVW